MASRAGLLFAALGIAGLFGFDTQGCGGRPNVPPVSTTGGTGTTGVDGGSCLPGCGLLGESECGTRSDCRAVYVENGCSKSFDHCEAAQCPVIDWMAPAGCVPKHDANGCIIPECEPQSCRTSADCGPGFECEGLGACPPNVPACDQVPPGSGLPCCAPSTAQCVPVNPGCRTDADCGPSQVCQGGCACPPGAACLCPSGGGVCVTVDDGGFPQWDGGAWSSDGGAWSSDGGIFVGDGGWGQSDAGGCSSDAQCPASEVCGINPIACPPFAQPACDPSAPPTVCEAPYIGCVSDRDCSNGEVCTAQGGAGAFCSQPVHTCGTLDCARGEVCVQWHGGVMAVDGGVPGWTQCVAYPAQCANGSCDCVGHAICNGPTTCDASGGVTVQCYAP